MCRYLLPALAVLLRGPCRPPGSVQQHAADRGLSLLARASRTHAVYGAAAGEELEVLVYDCVAQRRLLFLHIPKNAGTTLEDLGHGAGLEWGKFRSPGQTTMPDGNQCSAWHVPPKLFPSPNPYADANAEVFCVTRDPWQRMVSEYMYLLSVYDKWPMPFVKDGPVCSVEGLNMFVQKSLTKMDQGSRYISDCHMLPQWDYIESGGKHWCDHILPIASLKDDFNALMKKSGLALKMASHVSNAGSECPELKQQSEAPRYGDVFQPETQAQMRAMYADDFAHLGDSLA